MLLAETTHAHAPYVVPCDVVALLRYPGMVHAVFRCAVSWYGTRGIPLCGILVWYPSMWLAYSASMGFGQTEGLSTRGSLSESTPASVHSS